MLGKNTSNKNISFYLDLSDESRNQSIFHFFMAQEQTEAGDYYNMSSINQIQYNILDNIIFFLDLYYTKICPKKIHFIHINLQFKKIFIFNYNC